VKIEVNGQLIESEDARLAINAAIQTFLRLDSDYNIIPPNFEDVQAWAFDYLNQWRGEKRAEIGLTSAAFQELCYTGKALEATRWLDDQQSPFGLAGEAQARGLSNLAMAQLVLGQWVAWQGASDQIEAVYFNAKTSIEAATSIEDIIAAFSNFVS